MPCSSSVEKPLLVLALGGNALSPPDVAESGYAEERRNVQQTGQLLRALAQRGYRLLVVHGNGPQVGRLLQADPGGANLDIHIAQTQGELGYLLLAEVPDSVCLLTRAVIDGEIGPPVKPVGPVLTEKPSDGSPTVAAGSGWRIIVPSPRPADIPEITVIDELLGHHHIIAAGGGGIPINRRGQPLRGVVDKDWTASLLARSLDAAVLVFATSVDAVYSGFNSREPARHAQLTSTQARDLIELGEAAPGSMAPKLESAADFVDATGRDAVICSLEEIAAAIDGRVGTRILLNLKAV
jgi:carbamate kinase